MFLDFVQKRANIQLFNQSRKRTLPFNSAGHPFWGPTFRGYFGHFRTLNGELLLIAPFGA